MKCALRAILSDIHSNLEALQAVLADIEQQQVDAIYNLGDTLGYGPNPIECLTYVSQMSMVLRGNHDQAVLVTPDGFCRAAENSILWTQARLKGTRIASGQSWLRFLDGLPLSHSEEHVLYVHGSPRNPMHEYVFPEDIFNSNKMTKISQQFDQICFAGHTHIPGLFVQVATDQWEYIYYEECESGFPIENRKIICNVGAVGQPRDEDERACYALFDGERIWFRRVEYDIETTVKKIYAVPELDDFLGDRLRDGR